MIMCPRFFVPRAFVLLFLVKAISNTSGIVVVKKYELKDNSTNALTPNVKINFTAITGNSIEIPTKQHKKTLPASQKSTNTPIVTPHSVLNVSINSSDKITSTKLPSTMNFTSHYSVNFTTIAPTRHHAKASSHKYYKVLLYVLIPLSIVLLAIGICFMVRHIQKVKRKRRLERELIHQYSYPNSEAGDDDQERLFEVESIINTHFGSVIDQEEKNFDAEIPQVSVAVGEGSKLVIEEESPLMDNDEASTSFNC